ncbi:MAG: hypothetical protein J7M14_00190, partial [Planctomycetes bacterium]|nr:hypothetical protein [Planctomycetota bacterium]
LFDMTGPRGAGYYAFMAAMSEVQWGLMALLGVLYVVLCVRVAIHVGKAGRSAVKWFFVTLLCTAIPAYLLVLRPWMRRAGAEANQSSPRRCRHCGGLLVDSQSGDQGALCPHCGMSIETEHLA